MQDDHRDGGHGAQPVEGVGMPCPGDADRGVQHDGAPAARGSCHSLPCLAGCWGTFASVRMSQAIASFVPERPLGALIRAVYPRIEPELGLLADFVPRGGTAIDVGGWF